MQRLRLPAGVHHRSNGDAFMPYSSLNRVVLIGRLTRDPELRALPYGGSVCELRIACNSSRRDSDGGYTEKPNYFDVNVYGASGESERQYMRKASRVDIDGRLDWREWETADQQRRQAVSVVADNVQFLDSPTGGDEEDGDQRGVDGAGDGELVGAGAGESELEF